ncbi:MAG: hypothetical protein ACRDT8_01245 [Micromonosporaceae bacterium]
MHDLMDQSVIVRFRRRLWSPNPAELLREVGEDDVIEGMASASGGWGSAV